MHFVLIASIIKDAKLDPKAREQLVSEFCFKLKMLNPNFKPETFRRACQP